MSKLCRKVIESASERQRTRTEIMIENLEPEVEHNLVKLLEDPDLIKSAVANLDVVKTAVENPEVVELLSEAEPDELQKIREE